MLIHNPRSSEGATMSINGGAASPISYHKQTHPSNIKHTIDNHRKSKCETHWYTQYHKRGLPNAGKGSSGTHGGEGKRKPRTDTSKAPNDKSSAHKWKWPKVCVEVGKRHTRHTITNQINTADDTTFLHVKKGNGEAYVSSKNNTHHTIAQSFFLCRDHRQIRGAREVQ
jgi:hypothetical protein